MANIVFTDPPPSPRRLGGVHPWNEIADALKANPGKWALCLRGIHSSYSSQINHGKLAAFTPAGAFEARSVAQPQTTDGKKTHDLYIRYLGETANEKTGGDDA